MRRIGAVAAVLVLSITTGCSASAPAQGPPPGGPSPPDDGVLATRAAHTMTSLADGDLLVAGGCDVDGCATATGSTYLLSGATATRVAGLAEARDAHTAVALPDGRVLAVGGFGGEGQPPLTSAELFDPTTERWTAVGSLDLGRGGHAAALLGDGRVLVAGGWVGPQTYTDTTEIFDPATGEFTPGPPLPRAVDGLAAAALPDGCVLVVGGQARAGVATDLAVRMCPDGTVQDVGPLATARFKHGIAVLDSGQVLVIGGTTDDTELLTSTEVYDPQARRFRAGPELRSGRYKMTDSAVALPDDRVVVAGGGEGVELLDVAAGRAVPVEALAGGRRSFSTLGISDGLVVLVGGYDESIRLTRTFATVPVSDL
jgi:hypothetical protein